MSKGKPYLPLYTGDFLRDTMILSAAETGAYLMLLICQWNTKACALPDDDRKLAKFARCSPRQWAKIKPEIIEYFTVENGVWFSGRLQKENQKVTKTQHERALAGATGGRAKALKYIEQPLAIASDLLKQKPTIPNQTNKKENIIKENFELFYDAYAYKKSRGQAEKAWAKIPLADHLKVIQGAKSAARNDEGYRQHPSTWLNAKGWLDEYAGQLINGELVKVWEFGIQFRKDKGRWPRNDKYAYELKLSECPSDLRSAHADLFPSVN